MEVIVDTKALRSDRWVCGYGIGAKYTWGELDLNPGLPK
jgi:hypothetical protein